MDADRVRRLRKKLGLIQGQFALAIAAHPVAISQWETGARKVPTEYTAKLELALDEVTAREST